ncbi:MAG: mechanosensitive ion channel family protein [Anaerolineaceae bacterium]|nr:mechanosensitive ion channel family protein [Anaerolineaceae bacterium]
MIIMNNPLMDYLLALLIFIVSYIALQVGKKFVVRQLKKFASRTKTNIDDFITNLLQKTKKILLLIFSIYLGSLALTLSETALLVIKLITFFALFYQVGLWANAAIDFWVKQQMKKGEANVSEATTMNIVGVLFKVIVWFLLGILALDNIPGVEITALVASLGIGGIAIGLAVQHILSDLFASVTIVLDKPFVIGDSIVVDDISGTVEHIGLKSVRLRSIAGEQIVLSTSDLLNSRIHNYQLMKRRRVVFQIGVIYHTPREIAAEIPAMLEAIIVKHPNVTFTRSHFKDFGDSALNFETVYWVDDSSFDLHMDTQQSINLEILESFAEKGIKFAYPTRTLLIEKDG